jgi:hypothetical protein
VITTDNEGRTVAAVIEGEQPKERAHEASDDMGSDPEPHKSRTSVVVWIVVAAIAIILFGLMAVLHATGILGPGSH